MSKFEEVTRRFHLYPDRTGKRQAEGGCRLKDGVRKSRLGAPLVTIITVCWNSAKTIEKTIRSVRGQTYGNIEYVIVDGASGDATLDIIRKHEDVIDYYVSEPDEGLYYAMNKGLELAQGEHILLLNSDDWYEPETVARLVAAKDYSGSDFVGALALYVNDTSGATHVLRTMPFDHSVLLRMPLRHETMLIPAALYDRLGPYDTDYRIISDYEFTIRLFQAGATYYEVPQALLNFSTDGVSNTDTDRLNQESSKLLAALFPFLLAPDLQRMTDHAQVGPQIFVNLANAHPGHPEFVLACRALLADRMVHSGKKWQVADLDAIAAGKPLDYPKVSVIVPFHQGAGNLAGALDTALTQSLQEIEVICVNDGATDGSQDVVDACCRRDSRVKSLRNPVNIGPGGARNAGIRAARGRYVFFLDSDDAIAPGALEKLYDVARAHDSVMVRGAFQADQQVHGQAGGGIKYPGGLSGKGVVLTTLAETPQLLASTEGHWAALYNADFARTVFYPADIRVGEDSFFLIKAHALAPSVSILPEVVYHYQGNPKSEMNRLSTPKYFDGLTWRRRAWQVLRDAGVCEIGENLLFNFWSEPYFDGLEKTLSKAEKVEYFTQLSEAFSAAGHKDAGATRNPDLRRRIETFIKTFRSASPVPRRRAGSLRIATLTTQDHGGAGVGSQRRVEALRATGVDAHIYCVFQNTEHAYVHKVPLAPPLKPDAVKSAAWDAWTEQSVLDHVEHPGLKARELFSKTGTVVDFRDLVVDFMDADIVHLHWVSGMVDFEHLGETLGDKPVVWTLADMNVFTGGCHYSEGCTEYRNECRGCPLLAKGSDLAHRAWKVKRAAYAGLKNLHVICPSQWLADCARESSLLGDRPIHMIPNAIPVDRFRPTSKMVARQRLGLPLDKKLVLFGADNLNNWRKGGDILQASFMHLSARGLTKGVEGVFFGNGGLDLGAKAHNMGHILDERKMSLIYAAADVFAFPSREDNAPLTVIESLLSGTPVVGFPVGNLPELVTHLDTGYIATYEDAHEFSDGLAWALKVPRSAESLMRSLRAHQIAKTHNDPKVAGERHIRLYRSMLAANARTKNPDRHPHPQQSVRRMET